MMFIDLDTILYHNDSLESTSERIASHPAGLALYHNDSLEPTSAANTQRILTRGFSLNVQEQH